MQTTTFDVADMQATYPQCISESKSANRMQALLWAVISAVLFVIYTQQDDKGSTLGTIQITLVIVCLALALFRLFSASKLTYIPTGSCVSKHIYSFSTTFKEDIYRCLSEGNTSRLKAFKNDDAGGLMVELLESDDKTFTAARLLKYEPHGYIALTPWTTMQ